jgi:hypothetical protein
MRGRGYEFLQVTLLNPWKLMQRQSSPLGFLTKKHGAPSGDLEAKVDGIGKILLESVGLSGLRVINRLAFLLQKSG